jgi:hypothetical protein
VVSTTPQPLYPRERPGTYCTGGWVGPRAGLNMREKSRPHRNSIPGSSSPCKSICSVIQKKIHCLFLWQNFQYCLFLSKMCKSAIQIKCQKCPHDRATMLKVSCLTFYSNFTNLCKLITSSYIHKIKQKDGVQSYSYRLSSIM